MGRTIVYNIIRFLALFILQVALLKNIGYFSLAVVFPYILVILLLPIGISNFTLFLISFLTGLCIDAFYDSIGIHASACVALALFRIFFHKITLEVDEQHSFNTPSWGNMGFKWFSTYVLFATFIHHLVFFFVETFGFNNFFPTLFSALLSTVTTVVVIFIISVLSFKTKSRTVN